MEMKEQVTHNSYTHTSYTTGFRCLFRVNIKRKEKKRAVFNQQYFIYYYQENIYYHTHIFKIII